MEFVIAATGHYRIGSTYNVLHSGYKSLVTWNGIMLKCTYNVKRREVETIKSIQQKIEIACSIAGITKTELGKRIGLSQSAFSQRLKTGKFSDEDFEKIAQALGAKYFSGFIFLDGNKVE